MDEIKISLEGEKHSFEEKKKINVIEKDYSLISKYHESEIEQNKKIVKTARYIIWAGFVVICIGIMLALSGQTESAKVTAASGVLTEFISAIIFAFVSISSKSKLEYFKQLSISEEGEKLIEMIRTLENKKAQEKLIDKMISNYCDRRSK